MKLKFILAITVGSLSLSLAQLTNLQTGDIDVMADADNGGSVTGVTFNDDYQVYMVENAANWVAGTNYILTAPLYVFDADGGDPAVLTIEAGTTVYSTGVDSDPESDNFGAIIVSQSGQIFAEGTADAPIKFTTIRSLEATDGVDRDGDGITTAPALTDRGFWGGLILLGDAQVANFETTFEVGGVSFPKAEMINVIEGFPAPDSNSNDFDDNGLNDLITYGTTAFPNNVHSAGVLRYVSIAHGGVDLGDGNEINGLTLGGVGSGTTLEYIEVLSNADDGIEFFGGTADLKYALVAYQSDDSLDLDEGYSGNIQFFANIQNTDDVDTAGNSVQDSDHGGEWDGNVSGDSGDLTSSPVISNFTFIGDATGDHAFNIDDFFSGEVYNGVVTNYADLVRVTTDFDSADTVTFGSIVHDVAEVNGGTSGSNTTAESQLSSDIGSAVADVQIGLIDTLGDSYDPTPVAGSPALTTTPVDVNAINSFFENVSYLGAFAEGQNWAMGWTCSDSVFGIFNVSSSGNVTIVDGEINRGATSFITFEAGAGSYVLTESADLSVDSFVDSITGITDGGNLDVDSVTGEITVEFTASSADEFFYRIEEE